MRILGSCCAYCELVLVSTVRNNNCQNGNHLSIVSYKCNYYYYCNVFLCLRVCGAPFSLGDEATWDETCLDPVGSKSLLLGCMEAEWPLVLQAGWTGLWICSGALWVCSSLTRDFWPLSVKCKRGLHEYDKIRSLCVSWAHLCVLPAGCKDGDAHSREQPRGRPGSCIVTVWSEATLCSREAQDARQPPLNREQTSANAKVGDAKLPSTLPSGSEVPHSLISALAPFVFLVVSTWKTIGESFIYLSLHHLLLVTARCCRHPSQPKTRRLVMLQALLRECRRVGAGLAKEEQGLQGFCAVGALSVVCLCTWPAC